MAKKMGAVLGPERGLPRQPYISFVHQGGTLKSLMLLSGQTATCQAAQFLVDHRDQGFPCLRIALFPAGKQLRHLEGEFKLRPPPTSGSLAENSTPTIS